ncbi:YdeI/OmpD-associated family protein [Georgenia alba]|uniref:YdeI family protein n=1 Tax=Georgenia alba TaxID=2233858 RepID=A0ABW2Q6X4_9MICO
MAGTPGGSADRPAVFFRGPEEFRAWLEENHDTADELWMELRKKHVPERGLTWVEAVPEALCFGWIDSLSQPVDADRRRQRWTPRRRGSSWSRINVEAVERLIAEGRMRPAGLAAFEARDPERTAVYSYEQGDEILLRPEHAELLAASPAATAFWEAASPSYRRTCVRWVASAKQEATRDRRMATVVQESAQGRPIPPARWGRRPAWLERAAAAAAAAAEG